MEYFGKSYNEELDKIRLTASYKNIKTFMLRNITTTTFKLAAQFRGDFTRRVRQMRQEGYEIECIRIKESGTSGEFQYTVLNPNKD